MVESNQTGSQMVVLVVVHEGTEITPLLVILLKLIMKTVQHTLTVIQAVVPQEEVVLLLEAEVEQDNLANQVNMTVIVEEVTQNQKVVRELRKLTV